MKKLLVLCSALFALSAVNAHAVNINGTWKGTGRVTDNKGANVPCESMEVTIVHTATVLNVSTNFVCGGQKAGAPGGNLLIKGSELWENGAKIGTITANAVNIAVKDADHALATSCSFTDKDLTFHTVMSFANDPGHVITFDGKVSR